MIVKNEASQLPRCFSTIKDHIDSWCIVDTGSTDDTIKVIKEELKDIPGQLIKRPWVNFGHNRTESLGFASTNADYLLLCDADEQIIFGSEFSSNNLVSDQYLIKYNGSLDYSVPNLIKSSVKWRFTGVTHEYLESDKPSSRGTIKSIRINDYGDGGSKVDKFTRDIQLLEQGLIDEPGNARYMFYLANTYKNISDYSNAIKWYLRRIDKGGWIEEVTCSYEYLGDCYMKIQNKDKAVNVWMEGYEYNPKRAECIYEVIVSLRKDGINTIAYKVWQLAKKIQYPSDDILFVRADVYNHLLDLENTYLSYYADSNKDVRSVFSNLLTNPNVNTNLLLGNYKFYSQDITNCEITGLNMDNIVGHKHGYVNSSPSICKLDNGNYLVNVRRVSYTIGEDGSYNFLNAERKINTINTHVVLDQEFEKTSAIIDSIPHDINKNEINGLEDVRLIQLDNGNYQYSANKWINEKDIRIVVGTVKPSTGKIKEENGTIIPSPFNQRFEKNWAPFIHENKPMFVYGWNPIRIGYVSDDGLLDITKTRKESYPHFRGSSPGYHNTDDNEYWFLVHAVEYSTPRHYYHAIIILDDKTFAPKKCSKLFTFEGKKIEFGLGLILEDNRVIMTYSTWDSTSKLKTYNKEKLFKKIF